MGKVLIPLVFIISPIILFITILIFTATYIDSKQQENTKEITFQQSTSIAFASLNAAEHIEEIEMQTLVDRYLADPRIEGVRNFFSYYKSPLEPFAEDVVILADIYGIDYRYVPAIAMQESTLCKKIPKGSNNCWGFGIYGSKKTGFDSYLHGIHIVTKALATRYIQQGLTTPEEIMKKYTPSNKGGWARNVGDFMARIEQMTPQSQNYSSLAETNRKLSQPEKELEVNRRSLGFAL